MEVWLPVEVGDGGEGVAGVGGGAIQGADGGRVAVKAVKLRLIEGEH